jgi:hypothetical protein
MKMAADVGEDVWEADGDGEKVGGELDEVVGEEAVDRDGVDEDEDVVDDEADVEDETEAVRYRRRVTAAD